MRGTMFEHKTDCWCSFHPIYWVQCVLECIICVGQCFIALARLHQVCREIANIVVCSDISVATQRLRPSERDLSTAASDGSPLSPLPVASGTGRWQHTG